MFHIEYWRADVKKVLMEGASGRGWGIWMGQSLVDLNKQIQLFCFVFLHIAFFFNILPAKHFQTVGVESFIKVAAAVLPRPRRQSQVAAIAG